jgi:hypothetical protein
MSVNIGIIGSRDLSGKISFKDQVEMVKKEVLKLSPNGDCVLISGGSSWSDFIAVVLKNELPNSSLILYLPSDFSDGKFIKTNNDQGAYSTLNKLHETFRLQTGINSLEVMESTKHYDKVQYITHAGFLNRNNFIAKNCDHLIALSHGEKEPDSQGTLFTWNKASKKNRIHIHVD